MVSGASARGYVLPTVGVTTNGLLLQSDVHTLFDRGYVTITPNYEFRANRRLRQEFDNGEEYFRWKEASCGSPREVRTAQLRISLNGTTIAFSSAEGGSPNEGQG
jgi:HNH endonuclease